jgi:predicted transcriptional regulator
MTTSTITVRADEEITRALEELGAGTRNRSAVIREAIISAAREHRRNRLREEAEQLAADPDDAAEMRAVQSDMESLRAW